MTELGTVRLPHWMTSAQNDTQRAPHRFVIHDGAGRDSELNLADPNLSLAAVVEVNHAAGEAALGEQLEVEAHIAGEGLVAASDHVRGDEQLELVDQPRMYGTGGEMRTAHRDVSFRFRLQLLDSLSVEVALAPRPGAGHRVQRPGEHDLVRRAPDPRVIAHDRGLLGAPISGLPVDLPLQHPPPVQG